MHCAYTILYTILYYYTAEAYYTYYTYYASSSFCILCNTSVSLLSLAVCMSSSPATISNLPADHSCLTCFTHTACMHSATVQACSNVSYRTTLHDCDANTHSSGVIHERNAFEACLSAIRSSASASAISHYCGTAVSHAVIDQN
jgi:hypothetical protein